MTNRSKIFPIKDTLPPLDSHNHNINQEDFNLDNNTVQLDQSGFQLKPLNLSKKIQNMNFEGQNNQFLKQSSEFTVQVAIQTEKNQKQEKQNIKRKKISIIVYVLVMIISLAIPVPFLFYFIQVQMQRTNIMILTISIAAALVLYMNIICVLGLKNLKLICQYIFMLDDIMLTILGATASMIGMLYIFSSFMTQDQVILGWITSSANIFSIFTIAANFRVMIRFCSFNCCQVIIYKIVLMIDSMTYVVIGCYVYVSDYSPTQGYYPSLDVRILNFILLYIFSLVGFYVQLFAKISDFDGTGDLIPRYKFQNHDDQQESQSLQQNPMPQQDTSNSFNNVDP